MSLDDAEQIARAEFVHRHLYLWPQFQPGPMPVLPGLDGLCECASCVGATALRRLARVAGAEAMFQLEQEARDGGL